ncbi:hypothetical protein LguiB_027699 [Lonicera macranthoides]
METSKRMFLAWYMEMSLALSLDDMVRVAIDIEEEARMSYLERFHNISSQEFSKMVFRNPKRMWTPQDWGRDSSSDTDSFLLCICSPGKPRLAQSVGYSLGDTILPETQFQQHLATCLYHLLYKEHNLGDLIIKYFCNSSIARSLHASPNDWNNVTDILDFLLKCYDGKIEVKITGTNGKDPVSNGSADKIVGFLWLAIFSVENSISNSKGHPTNHKKEIKEIFSGYQTSTKLNVILKSDKQPLDHPSPKRSG